MGHSSMPTLLAGHHGTLLYAHSVNWALWDTPVITALGIMRPDDHEFEDIFSNIAMSGQPGLCSKTPPQKQTKQMCYVFLISRNKEI